MREIVPMSSADLDESDVQAVVEVLRSGRLALGPQTMEFERRMAASVMRGSAIRPRSVPANRKK